MRSHDARPTPQRSRGLRPCVRRAGPLRVDLRLLGWLRARPWPYNDPKNHGIHNLQDIWGTKDIWGGFNYYTWENLSIYYEAKSLVKQCELAVGRDNVCFLTSPADQDGCVTGKSAWIKKYFPYYERKIIFTKSKFLLANENSILIDDYDVYINDFKKHGGKTILVPRLWNSNHMHDEYSDAYVSNKIGQLVYGHN